MEIFVALLVAETGILMFMGSANHWFTSSSSIGLLCASNSNIEGFTSAALPSNWTGSGVASLWFWIAKSTVLFLIITAAKRDTSATTVSVFGENMGVSSASAWIVGVTGLATVLTATKDGTTASLSIDVDVFSAEGTIISVASRAGLPTDWTDSVVAWITSGVAQGTILLLVALASVEWSTGTSTV